MFLRFRRMATPIPPGIVERCRAHFETLSPKGDRTKSHVFFQRGKCANPRNTCWTPPTLLVGLRQMPGQVDRSEVCPKTTEKATHSTPLCPANNRNGWPVTLPQAALVQQRAFSSPPAAGITPRCPAPASANINPQLSTCPVGPGRGLRTPRQSSTDDVKRIDSPSPSEHAKAELLDTRGSSEAALPTRMKPRTPSVQHGEPFLESDDFLAAPPEEEETYIFVPGCTVVNPSNRGNAETRPLEISSKRRRRFPSCRCDMQGSIFSQCCGFSMSTSQDCGQSSQNVFGQGKDENSMLQGQSKAKAGSMKFFGNPFCGLACASDDADLSPRPTCSLSLLGRGASGGGCFHDAQSNCARSCKEVLRRAGSKGGSKFPNGRRPRSAGPMAPFRGARPARTLSGDGTLTVPHPPRCVEMHGRCTGMLPRGPVFYEPSDLCIWVEAELDGKTMVQAPLEQPRSLSHDSFTNELSAIPSFFVSDVLPSVATRRAYVANAVVPSDGKSQNLHSTGSIAIAVGNNSRGFQQVVSPKRASIGNTRKAPALQKSIHQAPESHPPRVRAFPSDGAHIVSAPLEFEPHQSVSLWSAASPQAPWPSSPRAKWEGYSFARSAASPSTIGINIRRGGAMSPSAERVASSPRPASTVAQIPPCVAMPSPLGWVQPSKSDGIIIPVWARPSCELKAAAA